MSLFRCVECGSPNIRKETQNGPIKYDYVKGAVGTVLLGVGGAAAGIKQDQQIVYRCPDCGAVSSTPMSNDLKTIIDVYSTSVRFRNTMEWNGSAISWEFLKGRYKYLADNDVTVKTECSESEDELVKRIQKKLMKLGGPEYFYIANYVDDSKVKHDDWIQAKKESDAIIKAEVDKKNEEIVHEFNSIINGIKEETTARSEAIKKELIDLNEQLNTLENKKTNLGFFAFSEKKRIESQISELTNAINNKKTVEATNLVNTSKEKIAKAEKEANNKIKKYEKEVTEKYSVGEDPTTEAKKIIIETMQDIIKVFLEDYNHLEHGFVLTPRNEDLLNKVIHEITGLDRSKYKEFYTRDEVEAFDEDYDPRDQIDDKDLTLCSVLRKMKSVDMIDCGLRQRIRCFRMIKFERLGPNKEVMARSLSLRWDGRLMCGEKEIKFNGVPVKSY